MVLALFGNVLKTMLDWYIKINDLKIFAISYWGLNWKNKLCGNFDRKRNSIGNLRNDYKLVKPEI